MASRKKAESVEQPSQKWEYVKIDMASQALHELGQQGWELVTVIDRPMVQYAWLKRRVA